MGEELPNGWREAMLAHMARQDAWRLRQAAYMHFPTHAGMIAEAERLERLAGTLTPSDT